MRTGGAEALAGLGVTTPVILFLSAFAALVSMGGAPKAAIALGKNERDMAERIMGSCMAFLLIISVFLTAGMLIWGKDILLLFGASEDTISYAVEYMRIYCLGTVLIQLSLGLNTFITTQGYARISMVNVAIGAVINVILDPVLIYVCKLGIKGAALATVFAQAVSCVFIIGFLISEKILLITNFSSSFLFFIARTKSFCNFVIVSILKPPFLKKNFKFNCLVVI